MILATFAVSIRLWRTCSGPLCLALCLYGSVAHAQDLERARQLFDEATALREAGQYADAAIRLEQAIAIKETPGLQYHAGYCEAKQGHYRKAIEHYERAAELLRAGASAPDVAALLARAHESALEHVAHLSVVLSRHLSTAKVTLDDGPERALDEREILVDPGKHHIFVTAPGYVSETREVSVADADRLRLEFNLVSAAPPSLQHEEQPTSAWKNITTVATLGVTAIGLTTGVVGAVGRHDAHVRVQAARADTSQEATAKLAKAQDDEHTYATWETAGFITAGVGAISAVALWMLWPEAKTVAIAPTARLHKNDATGLVVSVAF